MAAQLTSNLSTIYSGSVTSGANAVLPLVRTSLDQQPLNASAAVAALSSAPGSVSLALGPLAPSWTAPSSEYRLVWSSSTQCSLVPIMSSPPMTVQAPMLPQQAQASVATASATSHAYGGLFSLHARQWFEPPGNTSDPGICLPSRPDAAAPAHASHTARGHSRSGRPGIH